MAVAFDAVGPSGGAGASGSNVATINWSHVSVGTTGLAGIVSVAMGDASTTVQAWTLGVTWGGVAMTPLGKAASGGTTNEGYVQLFGIIAPPTGTQSIVVTATGSGSTKPSTLIGGSISLTGASSFGAAVTKTGSSTSANVSVTGTSTSNMFAAGFCAGQPLGSAATSPLTKRWLKNLSGVTGAGEAASGTAAGATGSTTLAWPVSPTNDWAAVGVEALAASAPVVTYTGQFFPFF